MKTIAQQLRDSGKTKTPYQIIAEKFNTDVLYVGQIARGVRKPIRGKGLKILNELQELTQK
ncbi:MAG: XRE family transcriptional regulator [Chryseobacterium sp.]